MGEPLVLVAPALLEAETEGLFCALTEACAGTGIRFVIKTHPNKLVEDKALTSAVSAMDPGQATIVPAGADVYDYLAASDALICPGSWIAFDAMALNVMPLVFQDAATFAGTSLVGYEHGLFIVRDAADVRAALDDLFGPSVITAEKRGHWPGILTDVFGDLSTPLVSQLSDGIKRLGVATES